ncbi:hypothetical protein RclHR1_00890013 [Rhizophagus clarus]|uniref:Ion transport domain-containing protein n=1 Tax=Rhizophagus clarus TaxID=94130 RepID=A0A2Z6SP53_9GLOM|nr:hypothetical protein RclHR1_00890013 [Rhizophagus clarus]
MINFFANYFSNTNKNDSKNKNKCKQIYTHKCDTTTKKEDYQIAICQDGKHAVTFDRANLRIRLLDNTDHRPFKKVDIPQQIPDHQNNSNSDEIKETIAYFKIDDHDLSIDRFYSNDFVPPLFNDDSNDPSSVDNDDDYKFRWSLDISNMQEQEGVNTILVAISRIDVDEDMKKTDNREDMKHDYKKGFGIQKYNKSNKPPSNNRRNNELKHEIIEIGKKRKGTAIYRLTLNSENDVVVSYHCNEVSGICNFIEDDSYAFSKSENGVDQFKSLKRFLILNFQGIYNFGFNDNFDFSNLTEKFDYPKSIRREFNNWHSDDCMKRLLSCIYRKYLLVTQYKNDVQSLEVFNLTNMELETTAKRVENKDKFVKQYNYDTFSVSRLQLCFTRGIKYIRLFYMENGLQVASRNFDEIEKIHSLEFVDSDEKLLIIGRGQEEGLKFVIWDLYDTGKVESTTLPRINNLNDCLARTSGNILQVDDEGNVRSVLKRIENELKQKNKKKAEKLKTITHIEKFKGTTLNGDPDGSHTIYFDKNVHSIFKQIVIEREPWVLGDYERNSYCLYQNKQGTRTETLQLIIGRSTVQIWHRVQDDSENKDDLPNKGEPFLEYIWTNRIPVNQERDKTRLRIEKFECGPSDGSHDKLNDFHLKVYWYERKDNEENIRKKGYAKKKEQDIINEEDNEIDEIEQKIIEINEDKEMDEIKKERRRQEIINDSVKIKRREKLIKRKDITEKFHAIRHACKALEHLNKRYKSKFLADNYNRVHKYEEIVTYVKHIIWRFVKHKPKDFMLLDVRYNFMKSLILGDSDHLIKYTLFGDEREQKEFEIRHIPRNTLWPGEKFLRDDDLDLDRFDRKDNRLEDNEEIKPGNNMELAIYHCKGRELKDTIIVAYLLEYYSKNATDCAGWMSAVSTAIPLLFKYNYDDYARKLFNKECFADQNHFSANDPNEIIPIEYQERRNNNIKFRAFRPIVKLKSDKYEWYYRILNLFNLSFKHKIYKYFEDFDNDLGKSPLALRVVPLPGFTISNITKKKVVDYDFKKIFFNILWIILVPRSYKISRNEWNKLSPFSRMILYENNDNIYDNPATEAVINFRWQEARNFFLFLFLRFFIFAICFVLISWAYLNHSIIVNEKFLFALIIIFYYLAFYQLVTELLQFHYRGPKKYFGEIFNSFDIISIALSVTVMTIMLKNFHFSDGFGRVEETDTGLIAGISFSIFFLWIELVDSISPINIKFVLLRNPENIRIKETSYSGLAADTISNTTFNIKLETVFDPKSKEDNPFSFFPTAIEAAYFWIGGNLNQRDEFDFWAVDLITLIATQTKGRQTLLRHRANHIADYEALYHIHFRNHEPEPKHIYYFGQSKTLEDWYNNRKNDQGAIYKGFEEKSTFTKRYFREKSYDKASIWVYD